MKGKLYIDGTDAYAKYGVFVVKGSYDDLVALPSLKEPDKNDWPEEDGQEVDLSAPALNSESVGITLGFTSNLIFNDFVNMLAEMGYHDFRFTDLGRTYRLRLSSQSSYEISERLEIAKFGFENDFPRSADYVYREPVSNIPMPGGYEIDDKDLSGYGISVLQGSLTEVLKSPAVKKNLLQDFKNQDGAVYDGEAVRFQAKEVNIRCLMRAESIESFWRNRDALLHDLSKVSAKTDSQGYEYRDAERRLFVESLYESYPCYYKSCRTDDFAMTDGVWWEFTLTLVFTSFRVEEIEYLLAAESGELIVTEDEQYYINLK